MINDFLTKLNQTFIDDPNWFNQFISNEKGEGGEGGEELVILDEDALKEYFELNLIELSKLISKSIISGEYVIIDIEIPLKESLEICDKILASILFVENSSLQEYTEYFVGIVKRIHSVYLNFYKQVKTHISNPNTDIVFSTSKEYSAENDSELFKPFEKEISGINLKKYINF